MSEREKAPRRRVVLKIELGADSWKDMAGALSSIAFQMHEAHRDDADSVNSTSGGYSWGGHHEGTQDRTVTHDSYFEASGEWLRRAREADWPPSPDSESSSPEREP